MKMSLCNTFRFFAVSTTIVLSIVGSPVPGLVNRQESIINQDLEHQESLTVELKSDDKGPNYINSLKLNNVKGETNSISLDSEGTKKNLNKNSYQTTTSTDKATQNISVKDVEQTTIIPLEQVTEAILSTATLNITLVNQQTEATVNFTRSLENTNSVGISDIIEKKTSITQDLRSQDNDTINENQTNDMNTTIELERTTKGALLDIKIESTVTTKLETETSLPITNAKGTNPAKLANPIKLSPLTSGVTTPTWKKYTIIERKRLATTSDEVATTTSTDIYADDTKNLVSTLSEELITVTDKSEVMVKSASAQGRISLQDAITSDIPSLEKLKSDLLSFPKFTTISDAESTTRSLSTEENMTETDLTTFIITTFPSTLNSESPNTVSSKRAGYLDLSAKNSTVEDDNSFKTTESLQGPFDAETPDAQDKLLDDKDRRAESQSQLAEDAIKEELMKEEMLNDNEEISKRHRDEGKEIDTDTPALQYTPQANATQFDDKRLEPPHTAPDENLSVRPINLDKAKSTILYPVNPNYKPLKKIEVQPAKPFVRDPDDNSWRNESLSSLGIVFKPKNSSKPFTQVLKNKTETEWNNLPEKDIKSEVPDLRVRLEQIAQKRKSKKKKIDSLGNVFYTDYEENSSSEENPSTPQVEDPTIGIVTTTDVTTSGITIVTPIQTTSLSPSAAQPAPASEANDAPALTTTAASTENTQPTPKKEPTKVTMKRPKMFNLFDYYETNDDEDIADYLNMAKIDLKKYTVPIHTTFTPYTTPPLPILYTTPMTQYTPERKGTIQYFPPRTTKRPRKNKHPNIQNKISPLTLTESPKHVLPISYHKLTTPYDGTAYYTGDPDARFKEESGPRSFNQNSYLTTPPLTTVPDERFGVIGNDGGYNRPSYVIKHYKDYLNEAVPGRGEHRGYPLTERPASDDAMPDFVGPTTVKDKPPATEEYDYEAEFRKNLLDRFVANFNEKAGRFKSDYPIVYNNSIVHGAGADDREVAMSRAYFRRPYDDHDHDYRPGAHDPADPCDNVTVELSPAYELHYYVPEQEEKQEAEARPIDLPVRYRSL